MTYTERQQQIIAHFANVYREYGDSVSDYPIMVWRVEDETLGFIYPQEVEELIDAGCSFFTVTHPEHPNMWTSPNFKISPAILTADTLPMHVTKIRIKWSESRFFHEGQTFTSVKDFEIKVRIAAKFAKVYDKTSYIVTWSNGEKSQYRTDCGDEYTHNYNFFSERKQYRQYLLAHPELIQAYGEDEQTLRETLDMLELAEAYQRKIES